MYARDSIITSVNVIEPLARAVVEGDEAIRSVFNVTYQRCRFTIQLKTVDPTSSLYKDSFPSFVNIKSN
ncbi:hypothetical protein YC2023_072990 [Brassica napus]